MVCAEADQFSLFVRCWELVKCFSLSLHSALWYELGNFVHTGEIVEGFCVGVRANVIFVPACQCRHRPLDITPHLPQKN